MVRVLTLLLFAAVSNVAVAEVIGWQYAQHGPYADGKPQGDCGPYEQWTGVVRFALDPAAPANQQIVDLKLAPKNREGKVEFSADFRILLPADRSKTNGAVFYEVNNRGNATAPRLIEGGADDFLCRQGFVVLSSGWIAQVQPGDGKLRLEAPPAIGANGLPIRGLVREELVVDRPVPRAAISHRGNQGSYPPSDRGLSAAKVTRRLHEADPRQEVPRDQWRLVSTKVSTPEHSGQLPLIELEIDGGLAPGWIYEIVYEAEGPLVQGVGMAGIRDIISALKDPAKAPNLVRKGNNEPMVNRALAFGTSQSGRLLRHFLWEGFNADEKGRRVFEGVISHVAGGGLGSFNHRFASPTRTNGQHDEHLFPADYFPFTYGDMTDPLSGQTDGILRESRLTSTTPKVFHTQSSSEYWHRSGSLVHTDPLGKTDAEIPPEVRIYTFGGTQHGSGSGFPGQRSSGQLPPSPADYSPLMRALVVALDAWVKDGTLPPPSVYPKIADGTLADWQRDKANWPAIDGVNYPAVIQQPHYLDRGPQWDSERIATIEPPIVRGTYVVKVPAYDQDGNERGTLNLPAITAPVATYTSWNLRHESIGAAGELLSLQGGYIPFAKDAAARAAAKDPRRSIAERYKSYAEYEQRYMEAAEKLVTERYLLAEDLPRLKALCERFKPVLEGREGK